MVDRPGQRAQTGTALLKGGGGRQRRYNRIGEGVAVGPGQRAKTGTNKDSFSEGGGGAERYKGGGGSRAVNC